MPSDPRQKMGESGQPDGCRKPDGGARPFLYHFCCEHSRRDIGEYGTLRPNLHPLLGYKLVWMTTSRAPNREAVGLTMTRIRCDRMEHCYEVLDAHGCEPFYDWAERRGIDGDAINRLTAWHECEPQTWWVSEQPVAVRVSREPEPRAPHNESTPPAVAPLSPETPKEVR